LKIAHRKWSVSESSYRSFAWLELTASLLESARLVGVPWWNAPENVSVSTGAGLLFQCVGLQSEGDKKLRNKS
jgi:hypothetical protein